MKLSVLITTYNRQDELVDCLQSLRRQFDPPEEIVVVDDGNVAVTRNRLREEDLDTVELVEGSKNGLPVARNRGVETATGDIVAFVDDDVVLPPNWSRNLKRTYEWFPKAAGVGGYVLNYNPSEINKANNDSLGYRLLQGLRKAFLYDRVGEVSPLGILYAPHVFMTSEPRRVDVLQGCNMSYRYEVLEAHAFDEWYGTTGSAAGEEIDFAAQVSSDGGELIYNPRLVALHKRSLSNGSDGRSGGPNYGDVTNLTYFVLKHPDMGITNVLFLVIALAMYSILTRNFRHLLAAVKGMREYWEHGRDPGSEQTSSGSERHD